MTKAEKTKQLIIEKSAPIFNTKGIAATAMSDIMAATKLSKGSLYVHFEDKDALSRAVVDYTFNKLGSKIAHDVNNHHSAKDKLMACFDHLRRPLPVIEGGCPMLNFGMEADDTNPEIAKKVAKIIVNLQRNIISIIQKGIASGEFKKNIDAKTFAIKSFAMIEGGVLVSRVTGKNQQMKIILQLIKDEIDEMIL